MKIAALYLIGSLLVPLPAASAVQRQSETPAQARTAATGQPKKWWLDERYRIALGLSPEQASRIDRIYEDHSAVQRQLWASLQEAEREVSKLMAVDSPAEAQVVAAIERAELLRYKINERRALCLFRIRQQLTLDQHRKLVKLHEHEGGPKKRH